MEQISDYLLKIIAAAMICAAVSRLFHGSLPLHKILKLLCGVFMVCTILSLRPQMEIRQFVSGLSDIELQAQSAVRLGEDEYKQLLKERIQEQTQAYILEKAHEMDADLEVEVELSNDDIPVPVAVTMIGKASPYVRQILSGMITDELGIDKERQIWT